MKTIQKPRLLFSSHARLSLFFFFSLDINKTQQPLYTRNPPALIHETHPHRRNPPSSPNLEAPESASPNLMAIHWYCRCA
ncbi:hypothetical protein G4B88_004410 [Cannabis sativa]|uniref:Uncharacterized protein n=1 Tax=Cannabis sativa TaxID=3483 RepID=A0A7J6HZZ3_CANSA|nr:hypothetical protein G4B88_004410 [Cannabis sativa]